MKTSKTDVKAANLGRYRVPILDRTLDVLEHLAGHPEGVTVSALAEHLKMPKNSAFRITTTLLLRGYLDRDESSKACRISGKVLGLGHAALGGGHLLHAAWPVLTSLRDETGETALIGTLAGSKGVVLDQVPSSHPVKVVVETGHAFPLHTAAPAKAMLAFLDSTTRESLVRQMPFPKKTARTLTGVRAYRAELESVGESGYALDRAEENETFSCAAAPVFNQRGQPVAAIWVSGPLDRMPLKNLPKFGEIVRRHAAMLTGKMGGLPPVVGS